MYNVTVYFEGKPGKEPIEHVYNNVPEGVTPEQVAQRAQADYPGETIVEIARRPANPGPIVDENAPLAKPASQQIVTRGKVSEADTRRLQMLDGRAPFPLA